MPPKAKPAPKSIETLTHTEAARTNIPTVEQSAVARERDIAPVRAAYERRVADLDPQLVWRGKYGADGPADDALEVRAAPLYIQEKVHPKALIDDLRRESERRAGGDAPEQLNLFADFNGLPKDANRTEFYRHDQNWSNRMILGDSLQVMAGLAEREGLRGKVQCIYIDPPYGIKFNSNFQWSTTSRDVKDGKADHITREPEQVKAFRDTWRDGIHSYLSYLRDRLIVARDLLTDSGSVFVQIGDENVHLLKSLLSEVFGEDNYVNTIAIKKKGSTLITESIFDFIIWFSRNRERLKIRKPMILRKSPEDDVKFNTLISPENKMIRIISLDKDTIEKRLKEGWRWARVNYPIVSQHPHEKRSANYIFRGKSKSCGQTRQWSFDNPAGLDRLNRADRLFDAGGSSLAGIVYHEDRPAVTTGNLWDDVKGEENPIYVVQTAWRIIQRCILMTTDPGDLVLDPTCGSGTTAYVAEQWGRRWITIDTSRVALALARARLMGARYPWYLPADSKEGQQKEAELAGRAFVEQPAYGRISHGFVYERVPHITLKAIANNAEIDVIWDKWQTRLEPLRERLNAALGKRWEEWEIPREAGPDWPEAAKKPHADWWEARIARQREIDASIAAKADFEYLYDRPYEDKKTVRVAGPFTVESLSPHRMLAVDADGEVVDPRDDARGFADMILEELKNSGVQQAYKADRIEFMSLKPWPGVRYINAEGVFQEGETERRAAIFIGPEFGSVTRQDLAGAAREAGEAGFDLLISCAFNYDAPAGELADLGLGRVRILKARMNADLHMASDLKGRGNLFVIFGEPDIRIEDAPDGQIRVTVLGVDVFDPSTGEVRSDDPDTIACWFIDTDYNEESFFVRHAYFLGAGDPYNSLKTTLKAEIDAEAWASLRSATSRPFPRPASGRIAVKVINHLGDEVMRIFRV